MEESEASTKYYSASDAQQVIVYVFPLRSVTTWTRCEGTLFQSSFDGVFYKPLGRYLQDYPLGRYLQDYLFDQTKYCNSCKEPTEAHFISYTHPQGNLIINVRRVPSLKLEGEDDGKIWMWHHCLRCDQIHGIPPASRRAVMSDADLELSFGKFLELGFSNYANANCLATCGHSLQRDCLQYYGCGSMVIFLQYSALEIFSLSLPSKTLKSQKSPSEVQRLLVPQNSKNDIDIAVYENEPTSIISYALRSREYEDQIGDDEPPDEPGGSWNGSDDDFESLEFFDVPARQSYGHVDQNTPPHLSISFEDESPNVGGKVKFSVTCYFAKQFRALRKRCCAGELDFIRSLSRCSAQGEKSNVYFAKSTDERFIIKQVTKTELESFEEFAPEYFKYLSESLAFDSPTCLAKILGIYQVTFKHLKRDKEMKMDLMVVENLFFKRKISGVFSIKDSARSPYISNTIDANISETIGKMPILLRREAKRTMARAIWNDSAFLGRVDVTDYSLLVGVDEECQELVVGIVDFMTQCTQYTLNKHLESLIKASCTLGGPKNATPTIIAPAPYKKRLRRAANRSFLEAPA